MRILVALAGLGGIGGLLIAWRAPKGYAPLFLVVGGVVTAAAVLVGLARDGRTGLFMAMIAVPYWGSFMLLWALAGVGGSVRSLR